MSNDYENESGGELQPMNTGGLTQMQSRPSVSGGDTGLSRSMAARAVEETRAAMIVARQFPRNEDVSRQKVIRVCKSPAFCQGGHARYSFNVGGSKVLGLSINTAKEIAMAMGNIQYGSYIIEDTPDARTIRAWAVDLETGLRNEIDDTFRKLVQRKTGWKIPDERELLMLSNLHSSKLIRNCILNITPFHIKEAAYEMIEATIMSKAAEDPADFRRFLLDGFADYGVSPGEINDFIGFEIEKSTPKQMSYLQTVLAGLGEGHSWASYLQQKAEKYKVGPVKDASDLASKIAAKAAEAATKPVDPQSTPKEPVKEEPVKDAAAEQKSQSEPLAQADTKSAERPKKKAATPPVDPSDGIP